MSAEQLLHRLAAVDDLERAAFGGDEFFARVDVQRAAHRLEEVFDAEGAIDDFLTVVAGLADDGPSLDAASREQNTEVAGPVVSAGVVAARVDLRCATELAQTDDERLLEQSALFEIREKL